MKAALEAISRSGVIAASNRRRIRDQGGQRALRAAMFEIEKLGISHDDWCKVQACLKTMIDDLND